MSPEREEDLKLYDEIFQAIIKHGKDKDKLLKSVRFKFNKEGTELIHSTFEWHWKKPPKKKPIKTTVKP
jgi:hypothetical protein